MKCSSTFLFLTALFFASCQNDEVVTNVSQTETENPVSDDFTISFMCNDDLTCDSVPALVSAPFEALEPKAPKPKYASVDSYFNSFKKEPQTFYRDASKSFIIMGREGTEIAFTEGSLVHADGSPVIGKVKVELEEFYHTADIVKARLTTQSDKGLLETAGMVNLEVYADGEKCKLEKGSRVEIAFAGNPGQGMQLFDGRLSRQGDIEWVEQKQSSEFGTKPTLLLSDRELVFLNNFVRDIGRRVKYPKASVAKKVTGTIYVSFFFDSSGNLRRPRIAKKDDNLLAKSVLYTFNNYPPINLDDYEGVPVNKEITMPIRFELSDTVDITSLIPEPETEKAISATELIMAEGRTVMPGYGWMVNNDYQVTRVFQSKENNMLSNSFKSVSLGWINCDRFLPKEPKTDIYVNATKNEDLLAYLVFKDINSVMAAYELAGEPYFGNVPIGRKAELIVVKATNGSEMQFAFQDLTITENMNISNLKFETLSKTEFTKRLNGLSKGLAMR